MSEELVVAIISFVFIFVELVVVIFVYISVELDCFLTRDTPLIKFSCKSAKYILSNPTDGRTNRHMNKQDQKQNLLGAGNTRRGAN